MDDAASALKQRTIYEPHEISGEIEGFNDGRLRGWLFDARSPGRAHVLAVAIDGVVIATVIAALSRADRDGDERRGCIGFDAAIDLSGTAGRELRVFLRDQPQEGLGPIILDGDVGDPWGSDGLGRAAHLFAHVTATHEASTRSSQHIFDHVTATHEANARRMQHVFDHVTATHERILAHVRKGAASVRLTDSGFAGVGRFRTQEQPDELEHALFKARVEKAVAAL